MNSNIFPLRAAAGQDAEGPVGRFLRWWGRELLTLLPGSRAAGEGQAAEQLVFVIEGPMLVCRRHRGGEREELGRVVLGGEDRDQDDALGTALRMQRALKKAPVLLLPPEWVAALPVTLPAAAKDNLRQVLTFEMDRQTPFAAADVYFDYRRTASSPLQGSIELELVTVPKRRLDELLQRLQALGVDIGSVDVRGPATAESGVGLGYNLLPAELRPQKKPLLTPVNIILLTVAAALLLLVMVVPLVQLYRAKAELETQVANAREEAEKVAALRGQYEKQVASFQGLLERKEKLASNVQVLGEMATLLPDDTWLNSLEIKQGTIRIQGESDAASQLISLLEESPLFEQTSFTSPVTQNSRTNKERFAISSSIGDAG
jgi:general secretion pathway protein L